MLLLGDKPTDCDVIKGLPPNYAVLKIGFMEDATPTEAALKEQLQCFDVVLTGDPSMDFINKILHKIFNDPLASSTS